MMRSSRSPAFSGVFAALLGVFGTAALFSSPSFADDSTIRLTVSGETKEVSGGDLFYGYTNTFGFYNGMGSAIQVEKKGVLTINAGTLTSHPGFHAGNALSVSGGSTFTSTLTGGLDFYAFPNAVAVSDESSVSIQSGGQNQIGSDRGGLWVTNGSRLVLRSDYTSSVATQYSNTISGKFGGGIAVNLKTSQTQADPAASEVSVYGAQGNYIRTQTSTTVPGVITVDNGGKVTVEADTGNNHIEEHSWGANYSIWAENKGEVAIKNNAGDNLVVTHGIHLDKTATAEFTAKSGSNRVTTTNTLSCFGEACSSAVYVGSGSSIKFSTESGDNAVNNHFENGYALKVTPGASASFASTSGSNSIVTSAQEYYDTSKGALYMAGKDGSRPTLTMTAGLTNTIKSEKEYAAYLEAADAKLSAGAGNTISGAVGALHALDGSVITLEATGEQGGNLIKTEDKATGYALLAEGKSKVTVSSKAGNNLV